MTKNRLLSALLTLTMILSLLILPVSAASYKDNTYTGSAQCTDFVDEEDFDYTVEATVTVEDGKINKIDVSIGDGYNEDNVKYFDWAKEGRTKKGVEYASIPSQIISTQSTAFQTDIDEVSGATCSSKAICEAVADALKDAEDTSSGETEEESVYVLMNIPYEEFYGAEGISNYDTDAISSATNKVGNVGKAGGGYHSAATAQKNEDGSYTAVGGANGAHMEGVTWPVKASLDDVKALGGSEITDGSSVTLATLGRGQTSTSEVTGAQALMEAPSYSYYVLSETPDQYMELTVTDGKASFSSNQGKTTKTENLESNHRKTNEKKKLHGE